MNAANSASFTASAPGILSHSNAPDIPYILASRPPSASASPQPTDRMMNLWMCNCPNRTGENGRAIEFSGGYWRNPGCRRFAQHSSRS